MGHSKQKKLIIMILIPLVSLLQSYCCSSSPPRIRAGYWLSESNPVLADLDPYLFTHLYCAFAGINSSNFHVSVPLSKEQDLASFSSSVKYKNPSIKTLLSIGDAAIYPTLMAMISNSSSRTSFIESSIDTATRNGFDGLSLDVLYRFPNTITFNSLDMATFFLDWRSSIDSHNEKNTENKLMLSLLVYYLPVSSFPVDIIQKTFDWVNLLTFDYFMPLKHKFAHPHACLYDPYDHANISTDYGIRQWINKGLSPDKILMGMPYHGWVWTLQNPKENRIGAPTLGPGITLDGSMGYKLIKFFVQNYRGEVIYDSACVENYALFGTQWIGFNDVDAIRAKVWYARDKGLRGYFVFHVGNDDNSKLSLAAAQIKGGNEHDQNKTVLLEVLLPLASIAFLAILTYFFKTTLLKFARTLIPVEVQIFSSESRELIKVFKFADISAATNNFSCYNKLGEGGFGPVYKGELSKGEEIAVKRLSKASKQGYEEFKNEVMLTARLQHVNLARVIGFCMDKGEKMLIYEYLPNRSLDFYLFDPLKRLELNWEKRGHIIEGIIQGLVYLQEYSRLTIIHRDLKASNILLDKELSPKISDFGMARIFQKDTYEANTDRIVGTYGYVPPEYVKRGVYSTKYDIYSFGVLLLHIISGKRNDCSYGVHENLNLLEYAFELWMDGKGMEFIDPTLDDSSSKYKVMRCMRIALLCVQEKQEDRPSMLEVLAMLKNEDKSGISLKRPAFSIKTDASNAEQSYSNSNPKSMGSNYTDSTISELEPR